MKACKSNQKAVNTSLTSIFAWNPVTHDFFRVLGSVFIHAMKLLPIMADLYGQRIKSEQDRFLFQPASCLRLIAQNATNIFQD